MYKKSKTIKVLIFWNIHLIFLVKIPKYGLRKMKFFLRHNGLESWIENTNDGSYNVMKDETTFCFIQQTLDDVIFYVIT